MAKLGARMPDASSLPQAAFELIVDLGQIRRRVTDHTIFALCRNELQELEDGLTGLLKATQHKVLLEKYLVRATYNINQFEDVYEHVINVTAKEPVVFILFINALRSLHKQCSEIK
jgi:hypothetical protein